MCNESTKEYMSNFLQGIPATIECLKFSAPKEFKCHFEELYCQGLGNKKHKSLDPTSSTLENRT